MEVVGKAMIVPVESCSSHSCIVYLHSPTSIYEHQSNVDVNHIPYIWAIYHKSLTQFKAILGGNSEFPYFSPPFGVFPTGGEGRYKLSRYMDDSRNCPPKVDQKKSSEFRVQADRSRYRKYMSWEKPLGTIRKQECRNYPNVIASSPPG